jgi:hypothetical protein
MKNFAISAVPIMPAVFVPCAVCEHEVPASEAVVAEAVDYMVYFCGLDCYERWRNQQDGR